MLELNITTAAKPTKPPPPKPAPQPPVEEREADDADLAPASPPPRKKVKPNATASAAPLEAEPKVPAAPAVPDEADAPVVKRGRYVAPAAGSAGAATMLRKEDPARAAALPSTLPLAAASRAGGVATFSATQFSELPLDAYLVRHLTERMELSNLTPVQQHAIPALLNGGDLLVRSPTGSGKTLAYAVPIVQALVTLGPKVVTRSAGTFAIVLVPTRELAMQTHEVIERLTTPFPWLVTSHLMGGEKRKAEKARLRKGVALLVGTPGRVSDHCEATSAWRLTNCAHLVLDEADRLLDLGFQQSVDTILNALERSRSEEAGEGEGAPVGGGATRQTVLLSATLSKGLRELAGRSLTDYATLKITSHGAQLTPSSGKAVDLNVTTSLPLVSSPPAADADSAAAEAADRTITGGEDKIDTPSGLMQSYALVPTRHRLTALLAFIRSRCAAAVAAPDGGAACKMIVFVSSCDEVDFLYELLAVAGAWPDKQSAALATGHADEVRAAIKEQKASRAAEVANRPAGGARPDVWDEEDEEMWDEMDMRVPDEAAAGKRKRPGGGDGGGGSGAAARTGGDGLSFDCALIGATVLRLHGQMSQRDRTQAFVRFRRLTSGVMFATDVAARGLNLEGIHWIVQHDLPQDAKEYLHRAGRTARLGQRGHAVLMLHPSELPFLSLLREAGVSQLKELKFASLQAALCPDGGRKDVYNVEIALQKQLEATVKDRAFMAERAAAAYQSYLRGYAALPKAVRRFVHVGQLHLGHLAKSFGLLEPPSRLSAQQSKKALNARASGRNGSEYLAGAEYLPREQREGARDYANNKAKQKKKLSLSERMKRQPKGNNARRVGGASSFISEFAA